MEHALRNFELGLTESTDECLPKAKTPERYGANIWPHCTP
jgi:hypothetical protein